MTTPWLYDENSQFYTKICDFWLLRTWFMAQDDSALKRTKKNWSVQHDAEKDVATIEKLANYLGASCFFTCWHSNTADGIGEPQSPRVYIYISTNITGRRTLLMDNSRGLWNLVNLILEYAGNVLVRFSSTGSTNKSCCCFKKLGTIYFGVIYINIYICGHEPVKRQR
jgi:hypothetical protein